MRELQLLTDAGHCILGRYHRTQDKRDLDQSLAYFQRSLDLCPIDHPCRSAALVNLAIAKFTDLDVPISLFQDALELRPTGHPDRLSTQLHLATAFLSRFTERGFQTDADAAEEMLIEVLDSCHIRSYVYRSAMVAIKTHPWHHLKEAPRAFQGRLPCR